VRQTFLNVLGDPISRRRAREGWAKWCVSGQRSNLRVKGWVVPDSRVGRDSSESVRREPGDRDQG